LTGFIKHELIQKDTHSVTPIILMLWKMCTSRSVREVFPSATNLVFFITHMTTKKF